jgi:hypothetical protein
MSDQADGTNGHVKQRAAIWIFVVFVLAVLLGNVSGYYLAEHVHAASAKPILNDDARRAQKVHVLTEKLSLTPDQAQKLDATIREAQVKFKAIRDASQPQIDATRGEARQKVRSFLNPDQLPKYEKYLQEVDEERRRNGQP